jgi:membrane protein DedA with SNARE-associated domain
MIETLQHSLEWVTAHPTWALVLFFLAALLDSIFVIGMFVPAGIALFAGGALVALGAIELWQAIALATLGAVAGDGFSYWLGRRYGERLFAGRFLRRHPEVLHNGRRFFARYGAYSIVLARFLGPMRAIVPALAGASGMRLPIFLGADIGSATVWAFTFVLPGVVFGASLGLAAEVAGRLALLLIGLLLALSLSVWLTVLSVRTLQKHAETWIGGMLDWSRRHRRLGKFGIALADPKQPETPVLLLLATVLLTISGIWIWLFAGAAVHTYPVALDAAVFQSLRDLHTPWGQALAAGILRLGEWRVYAPVALVTLACLLALRKPRAAAHWAAAVALGAVLSAGVYAIPTVPPPHLYFGTATPSHGIERDFVLATVVYAFLPVLLATGRPIGSRIALFGSSTVVLLLLLWARLYLGAQWYSIAVFSLLVGVAWAALLGLGYRRHRPERLPPGRLLPPILLTFVLSVGLALSSADAPTPAKHEPPLQTVTLSQWQSTLWQQLPHSRIDVAGRSKQTLPLQWAAPLDQIEAQLRSLGWQPLPALNFGNSLRWLTAESPIADLPVLPQVHAGRHPALQLRLPVDDDHEFLLRLWPSGRQIADGPPLWLGSVLPLQARGLYRLIRYPAADPRAEPTTAAMLQQWFSALDRTQIEQRRDCLLLFSTAG